MRLLLLELCFHRSWLRLWGIPDILGNVELEQKCITLGFGFLFYILSSNLRHILQGIPIDGSKESFSAREAFCLDRVLLELSVRVLPFECFSMLSISLFL